MNLELLPTEIQFQIGLDLDLQSLLRYCRVSKTFASICHDSSFWRQRIFQDFPEVDLTTIPLAPEMGANGLRKI